MSLLKVIFPVLFLVFFTGLLPAQLSEVSSREDFSTDSVEFDFEGPLNGALAGDLLSQWGLQFSSGGSGTPTILTIFELAFPNNFLLNGSEAESSADIPLVIDLKYPASKVGFELSNGDEDTQISVTAFDPVGNNLGAVQRSGLSEPAFLGVGTTGSARISKLLVSYGSSNAAERLDDLILEFVDRPQFVTFLAQVADGPIPGFGTFQTTIIVTNASNSTATGQLALFDSEGEPLELDFGQGEENLFNLQIPPSSSVTFVSSGTADPVGVGYARITTGVPVEGTAVFRLTSPSGVIASEAGVGSNSGRVDVVGAVEKLVADDFDSGIAAVNVGDTAADAELLLYDQSGDLVDRNRTLLDLPGGGHTSGFLSGIFPALQGEDFSGTIRIVSDVPIALVIMRTASGVVISSLPVGSLEK